MNVEGALALRKALTVFCAGALTVAVACGSDSTAPTAPEPWTVALRAGVSRANRDFAGSYRAVYIRSGCTGCSLFRDSAVTLTLDSLDYDEIAAHVDAITPKRFRPSDSLQLANPELITAITGTTISGRGAGLTIGQRKFRGTWRVETQTHAAPWLSNVTINVNIDSAPGQFRSGIDLINPAWSPSSSYALWCIDCDKLGRDSVWATSGGLMIDPSFQVLFRRQ